MRPADVEIADDWLPLPEHGDGQRSLRIGAALAARLSGTRDRPWASVDVEDRPLEDRPARRRLPARDGRVCRRTTSMHCRRTPVRDTRMRWTLPVATGRLKASIGAAEPGRALLDDGCRSTGWTSVGERLMTLQDLAGRRLLLQRFGEIAVANLQLLEEADVLDGDDGLVGEGRDKLDLLVGEGLHLGAPEREGADELRLRGASGRPRMVRIVGVARFGRRQLVTRARLRRRGCGRLAASDDRATGDRPIASTGSGMPARRLGPSGARCCSARRRYTSPSGPEDRTPRRRSQSRAALSTSVFRTGWRSKVERLMTLRTSLVAVCCSSASVRS